MKRLFVHSAVGGPLSVPFLNSGLKLLSTETERERRVRRFLSLISFLISQEKKSATFRLNRCNAEQRDKGPPCIGRALENNKLLLSLSLNLVQESVRLSPRGDGSKFNVFLIAPKARSQSTGVRPSNGSYGLTQFGRGPKPIKIIPPFFSVVSPSGPCGAPSPITAG